MKEIVEVKQFDACVKVYLKNELRYRIRTINHYRKHYISMSELSEFDLSKLSAYDIYPSDEFQKKINTRLFDAKIHDELLYEALLVIKPLTREIIILKFWGEMSDEEIGKKLSISRKMVNYYKNKALINLREIMEEINKNEQ